MALCYTLVCVLGWIFWVRIPVELTPNTALPSVTVSYTWAGASPESMEKYVTRKVEDIAHRLKGVKKIQSITNQGQSIVTIDFEKQTPIDYRIIELREQLNQLRNSLPATVYQGQITKRVPQQLAKNQMFMAYSLSGKMNRYDLLDWARRHIKLPLSSLRGLSGIQLNGVQNPALTITFDPNYIRQYNLSVNNIMSRLRYGMQWQSAGWVQNHVNRVDIVRAPVYKNIKQIRNLPIQLPDSTGRIRLGQIANIAIKDFPARSHTRINGQPALTISFTKTPGADAISLSKTIHSRMQQIRQSLPSGLLLHLELDSTRELRNQINSLGQQAWYSLLCVFLVLLLFIHEIRAPLLILSSIALSVLLSIILLYLSGYTLNLYTMAAITIALGMVVDNAIVVYEQVRPGLPNFRKQRIRHVASELRNVIVPVIGNTLTTVGIFLPLIFALPRQRFFLAPLGIAMSLTLLSSIVICLTWIPYALIWLIPLRFHSFAFLNRIQHRIDNGIRRINRYFPSRNRVALYFFHYRHKLRWPVYIGLILLIGIPLFLIPAPNGSSADTSHWYDFYFNNRDKIDHYIGGISYRFYSNIYFGQPFSGSQNQTLQVNITTPLGTPLKEIDKIAHNFETIAAPYRYAMSFFKTREAEGSGAQITYHFKKQYVDSAAPYLLKNDAIYLAARTGNSSISVSGFGQGYYSGGGGGYSSYTYKLTGYSYQQLLNLARELKHRLKQNQRVTKVNINRSQFFSNKSLSHYVLNFNKNALFLKGLNRTQILQNLELETNPRYSLGRVYLNNKQLFLMARIKRPEREQNHLMTEHRKVNGKIFSLNQIGHLTKEKVMASIRKENQSYTRYVDFSFIGPYQYGKQYAKHVLKQLPVPIGAKVTYGNAGFGQTSKQIQNLILLIIAAIVIVWMIVSALLESWGEPLVIIIAIPLSFIGIMEGFLYTGMDFGRGAFAGTMLLIGVVVNNAILLMHGHRLMEEKGIHGARSWLYTYKKRMTSVLLTTMTTLAGLVPLMFQGTSEFWNTMSITVFWGLSISTILIVLLAGIWDKPFGANTISNEY